VQSIIDAVNTFTDVTGVQAGAITGTSSIKLSSEDFGSSQFVSVRVVDDANLQGAQAGIYNLETQDFNTADTATRTAFNATNATNGLRDAGQDVVATINGIVATADGKTARINSDFLDVSVTFSDASGNNTAQTRGQVDAFTITGGGAKFQLAGNVDIAGSVSIGVSNIATRKLGNTTVGYLSDLASGNSNNVVDGDLNGAQKIVAEAINQVSGLRGRLGAFQKNTVGATIRSLSVSLENTTAAESTIRDANFATETAALTRNQILVSASTNILALANQQPQAALQLLG
jgi:flagellin